MEHLSLSPVIGRSIVGLGQVSITITEVLVVLMKDIINHLTIEVIMTLEDHTVLKMEVIETQITVIIVTLEVTTVKVIELLKTEIFVIMIITSQMVSVGLVVPLVHTNLHILKRKEGLSV